MRVWQAQIGLSKRVEKEYYGYVNVRDYSDDEFELPNPLMALYMTQKNNSKAKEFLKRMYVDVDKIIASVKGNFDPKNINDELKKLSNTAFLRSFNALGQEVLEPNLVELTEAFALGVALGRHDPGRRGEIPVVAIGLYKEALNSMQKEFSESSPIGNVCAVMLQRGFYMSRAINF